MSHLTRRELQDLRNAGNASEMAAEEIEQLRDVLLRNGFVRCDIAACNCGGYHARFGLRERFDEFKQALSDAGHPLTNENGNLPLGALQALVAERDALAAQQWQPIETAPKGGRRVLVWIDEPHLKGCAFAKLWFYPDGTLGGGAEGHNGDWNITHWMPLPPPPEGPK